VNTTWKYYWRQTRPSHWLLTKLFAKRERTLPPDQLEVRPVQTKRGITMVGLFSAAITRVEREADAPYREAIAAKRLPG
jgi:hypothetical protein